MACRSSRYVGSRRQLSARRARAEGSIVKAPVGSSRRSWPSWLELGPAAACCGVDFPSAVLFGVWRSSRSNDLFTDRHRRTNEHTGRPTDQPTTKPRRASPSSPGVSVMPVTPRRARLRSARSYCLPRAPPSQGTAGRARLDAWAHGARKSKLRSANRIRLSTTHECAGLTHCLCARFEH